MLDHPFEKSQYQFRGNFHAYLYEENQLHHSFLSWHITTKKRTCYYRWFGYTWPHTPKILVSIWRNLRCSSASKKLPSLFAFSLRYCKNTANLLFWLWAWLATHTQNDKIDICMPQMNSIIHFFLELLCFKECCNLIGQQHFARKLENQNFARYGISCEISTISVPGNNDDRDDTKNLNNPI